MLRDKLLQWAPTLYTLGSLARTVRGTQAGLPDGRWVPARPLGYYSLANRIRCSWAVFTGRADAVTWPGQGDGSAPAPGDTPAADAKVSG
jgi:hypothetical protein